MASRAVLAFAIAAVFGVAAVIWRASQDYRTVAFPLGPAPVLPVAELKPGQEVCQTPVVLPTAAAGVRFQAGARGPGPALDVTIKDAAGRRIASARTTAGYPDRTDLRVRFPTVPPGRAVSVCIRNAGARTAHPYGDDQVPNAGTVAGRHRSRVDLSLYFLRAHRQRALSLVPTMFRRASLFRIGWFGAWTFWTLAVLIALAVPTLCGFALIRAVRATDAL